MTSAAATAERTFDSRAEKTLAMLRETGQWKHLQSIEGPMAATVRLRGFGEVACFCSNNTLAWRTIPR